MPGYAPGAEITPEGYVYTGQGELVFRLGKRLRPFRQRLRTLEGGRYPIVRSSVRLGRVRYTAIAFAAPVAGRPAVLLRVALNNPTRRAATARWAVGVRHSGGALKQPGLRRFRFARPARGIGRLFQPGAAFDPRARHAFRGHSLTRRGRVLYTFPPGGRRVKLRRRLRPPRRRGRVGPGTVLGLTVYGVRLGSRGRAQLDFVVPLAPVRPGTRAYARVASASFDAHRARTLRRWRRLFGRALSVDLPERKVEDALYASLANAAMSRYRAGGRGWIQTVNKLQYHAFWLRDAAAITYMYDLVGLHRLARENLGFFLRWQRPDGLFISRPSQYDGFGQALWALGEHVRRTGGLRFARRAFPAIRRAMRWLARARRRDPLRLMPAARLDDNERTSGHLTGDNFWAIAGVERALALARALGEERAADRWAAQLADLKATLDLWIRRSTRRTGGWIPPALGLRRGQDWGNLWASYPARVYPARSRAVGRTLRHVRGKFREGIATYGGARELHHYLGFRVFQTELLRGEQERVVRGLYDSLAHTTATHGGFETGVPAYGSRSVDDNMSPHGWFAAEYVTLLRNMLVREERRDVVLMSALPPAWLRPGETVAVRSAPTAHGRIGFTLRTTFGGAALEWRAAVPPGTRLRWPVPAWARDVSVRDVGGGGAAAETDGGAAGLSADGRTITLPARSGRIEVRWRLRAPRLSYERSVRRLVSNYRRRGR